MFINGLLWCLLLVSSETGPTIATVSIACYGSSGVRCVEHSLNCTESLIVSITNITFGYRRVCSDQGVAICGNTTCCREETGDCFTPYNKTLLSQLQQSCNGRSTCTLNSNQLNEVSLRCYTASNVIYHSYSKIEYQCSIDHRVMAKFSTACYGIQGLGCTDHRLTCIPPLVISITNITFGYRQGCSGQGVSNCGDTTCCTEETGDCFTPYNKTLLSQLQQICNGKSTCILNRNDGLDEPSSYCDFTSAPIFPAYSKIEYQCVTNESTTYNGEFQETITSGEIKGTTIVDGSEEIAVFGGGASTVGGRNETAIVGGVLGTVIVICIIIIVLLVIYINRKLSKLKSESPVHHNGQPYASSPNRTIDESSAGYNSLNTRQENGYYNLGRGGQQPNTGQTNSSNNSQHSTIDGGDDQINQNNQHYEHQYDEAPRGTTDQPAAVYDSLNTREQTGYYNMGNINTGGKDK